MNCIIDTIEIQSNTKLKKKIKGIRIVKEKDNVYYYRIHVYKLFDCDIKQLYDRILLLFTEPIITRIDIAFDEYETSFDDRFKLMQLYISCFSRYLMIKNNYTSLDFMKNYKKLAVKAGFDKFSGDYAIEYYDKIEQMNRRDEQTKIQSRFEIRKRGLMIDIKSLHGYKELIKVIITLIDSEIKLLTVATNDKNYKATRTQLREMVLTGYYNQDNFKAYIIEKKDLIYDSEVITDFFKRFGKKGTPNKNASRFKANHNIKTFSRKEL